MAFALDPNQQQQQNQPQGTSGPGPIATSAAPGAGPAGAKVPTGAPNQQAPAQPFTNLQAYLSANAPQIQNEANSVAGTLGTQYGQVQKDINAGISGFNQQVAAGSTPENPSVVQAAAANPTQFVQDPNNVAAFKSQLNDQYTGPTNFEQTPQYAPINAEVTKGAANADLFNTPAGLQTYLQGSSPTETQGDTLLDTALIGANPQAIQQVQGAAAPFSQLPAYLSSQTSMADQAAQAAGPAAQKAAADAAAAMNPVVSGFQNTLAGAVPAAQAQENAYNAALTGEQQTLNPSTSYFGQLAGLLPGYGVDNQFTPVLNTPQMTGAANLANVATSQQYAEDAALAQLMGTGYNPQLNQANVGQAGTFNVPATSSIPSIASLLPGQDLSIEDVITNPNVEAQSAQNQGNNPTALAINNLAKYLIGLDPTSNLAQGNQGDLWSQAFAQ